eukprot:COSAG04_NODE_6396_length_1338_cov_0.865214_1_plen_82_part_00
MGKPLSEAHKRKIAAGVKAYHARCKACKGKKPKAKAKPKPKPKPLSEMDAGKKLRSTVSKIERRYNVQKDTAMARRIRGQR